MPFIISGIKLNPSVFHGFIKAIAGPSTDDVVKKLHNSYERHKTATSRVEQPQLSPPLHQQPPPEAPTSFSSSRTLTPLALMRMIELN